MSFLGRYYYFLINHHIRLKRSRRIKKNINKLIDYYETKEDPEIVRIIKYYRAGGDRPFPYSFVEKYVGREVNVLFDSNIDMNYVLNDGKKLYFPRELNVKEINNMYKNLCIEQDPESPHCYSNFGFRPSNKEVLIDIGCADGLYSLEQIDHVKKVYLFEPEERWMKPLKATFKPWLYKTEMTKTWVSDKSDETNITIDEIFSKNDKMDNCFIKCDVEGYEERVIRGATKLLKNRNIKIRLVVATYHRRKDFDMIDTILKEFGFTTMASPGYIFMNAEKNIKPPYLRKCLIMAKNFRDW